MRAPLYVNVLVNGGDGSIESMTLSESNHALRGYMRPSHNQETATLGMFSVATVFLLLASLVAAAGFAVVAQRRLRQLGMLAAIGATQKHVRLVLAANGRTGAFGGGARGRHPRPRNRRRDRPRRVG
jgi:putative ABC transport system permease protein